MAEIALKLVCTFPKYVPYIELEAICKRYGVSSLKNRLIDLKRHPKTFSKVESSPDGQGIRVELLDKKARLVPCTPAFNNEPVPDAVFPDEVVPGESYSEGAVRRVLVNSYERDREARRKCIEHYGAKCIVCHFDFAKAYDGTVQGFIHVHHLRKLSEIGGQYKVDPIADLRPVCPNCHAIIHLRKEPYSIEEVRAMVDRARKNRGV
jgi:predicted HNH restriction endonuclease